MDSHDEECSDQEAPVGQRHEKGVLDIDFFFLVVYSRYKSFMKCVIYNIFFHSVAYLIFSIS